MNSHGASSPDFTRADSASTMCVCGEIGYAQITSGRHSATVSATAREPSSCLRMCHLAGRSNERVRRARRTDVALARSPMEPLGDGGTQRAERDGCGGCGERAEERCAWKGTPEVLAREAGRRHDDE